MTISDEEHVARAIWSDWLPGVPWDSLSDDTKIENLSHARAAIAAMREREGAEIGRLKIALGQIANKRPWTELSLNDGRESHSDMRRIAKDALKVSARERVDNPAEAVRAKTIDECEAIARKGPEVWGSWSNAASTASICIADEIAALKGKP